METIKLKAMAKINLGLDVTRRRPDGYHEVRMVMQMVGIYDRITITRIPEDEIRLTTNLSFLPVDEHNIAWKAARLMREPMGSQRVWPSILISTSRWRPVWPAAARTAGP